MGKLELSMLASLCVWSCGYGDQPNPPPLNNLKGYPSRGPVVTPAPQPIAPAEREPDKQAQLESIAPAKVDARATLTQEGDDVRVSLKVESAPPGAAHVALDTKSCAELAKAAVPAKVKRVRTASPKPAEPEVIGLGDLTVSEAGKGQLATKLEGVQLNDDLLGRSLVFYEELRSHKGREPQEQPIACVTLR